MESEGLHLMYLKTLVASSADLAYLYLSNWKDFMTISATKVATNNISDTSDESLSGHTFSKTIQLHISRVSK